MVRILFVVSTIVSVAFASTSVSHATEPAFHIQAHRCAGIAMPENTLESAQWAWQIGVTPEVDLRMTRDKQIVCFHDPNFARVASNADAKTKKLGVEKLTLAELRKLDVGSFRGSQYADERIPKLESLFVEMHGHPERLLYLDIKNIDLDQLAELVRKYGVERQGIFTSEHYKLIQDWKKRVPESPTLVWNRGTEDELNKKLDSLRKEDFKGITYLQIHTHIGDKPGGDAFDPSSDYLHTIGSELKSRGIVFQVLPWESSDQKVYEKLLELGAESFATDYPEVTLAAVKSFREKSATRTNP